MKKLILFMIVLASMSLACMQSAAVVGGHVAEERVRIVAPTATSPTVTPKVYRVCGMWNVRGGASGDGPASPRYLADGDMVVVFEELDGWMRIGKGEWVNGMAVCK